MENDEVLKSVHILGLFFAKNVNDDELVEWIVLYM
jgi:hypothetical protein